MRNLFLVLIALGLAACSSMYKTVTTAEYFTLKRGETVMLRGTDLKIKMLENGVSQRPDGGDVAFCKLEVGFKSKTEEQTLDANDFASYDEWNIRLEKVNLNPDISKTSCVLVVARTFG